MDIEIAFSVEPLRLSVRDPLPEVGAVLEFQGVVRGREEGRKISALVYEIYEPMARTVIRKILNDLGQAHPCRSVHVWHRHGTIPVGELAIHVQVQSRHRKEGLQLLEEFMNKLKAEVPIWKVGEVPC